MGRKLLTAPGTPCRDCNRPMRPNRWPPDRLPGTVVHKAQQVCGGCWFKRKRAGDDYDLYAPLVVHGLNDQDPDTRHTAQGLQDWLTTRRNRGVPTNGHNPTPTSD